MIWKIVPCNKGFTKFQLNLPYLRYNTVLRTLEIRHYGQVSDVSETGLYESENQKFKHARNNNIIFS